MSKFVLFIIAALVSASARADNYDFRPYSYDTPTTTTRGGQVSESGSTWYLYGQQETFSTSSTPGANPFDSQSTTSGGIGYRW